MADEYQIEYEYVNGSTISIKASTVKAKTIRPHLKIYTRVDGTRVVSDTGYAYRVVTAQALISGNDADTLDAVQNASITYSGAYPRLKKIYWDGDSTESNVEVALMSYDVSDVGGGWWSLQVVFEEKDQ